MNAVEANRRAEELMAQDGANVTSLCIDVSQETRYTFNEVHDALRDALAAKVAELYREGGEG